MFCALSGEAVVEPVISVKSGHVFEKKLIEKHIKLTGQCPATKEVLTEVDLLPLKINPVIKPRPASATSIPSLVQIFQNEWDALMLETYNLKHNLENVRQELAHTLYQHDAACRVIARLIKERDDARSALANAQGNVASSLAKLGMAAGAAAAGAGGPGEAPGAAPGTGPASTEEGQGITGEVVKTMQLVAKRLSKGRKKRIKALSTSVVRRENLRNFTLLSSHPLHSAAKPGILCVDIHPTQQDLVITGGADANAIIFNRTTGKIEDTLRVHKKKVTDVKFHPTEKVIVTTSADHTAAIFTLNPDSGKYVASAVLRNHKADVVGCTLHPSGSYLVTGSLDKTWCFYDIPTGLCRQQVIAEGMEAGYTRLTFHPDGLILGAGTADSMVRIFDVKLQKNVANFKGHNGRVTGLAFSENGYYLGSADERGVIKLWDLRKLQNFHTISQPEKGPVNHIEFDQSGTYLAVAADDVRVYSSKGWDVVRAWGDHSKPVTACKFGEEANWFATTSYDRSLKFFGDAAASGSSGAPSATGAAAGAAGASAMAEENDEDEDDDEKGESKAAAKDKEAEDKEDRERDRGERDRDRESRKDRERERERERDRDRDRDRERERDRDRDREKRARDRRSRSKSPSAD